MLFRSVSALNEYPPLTDYRWLRSLVQLLVNRRHDCWRKSHLSPSNVFEPLYRSSGIALSPFSFTRTSSSKASPSPSLFYTFPFPAVVELVAMSDLVIREVRPRSTQTPTESHIIYASDLGYPGCMDVLKVQAVPWRWV